MMRHPKTIAARSTVALPVSTIDIAPTILDAVGLYAGRSVDTYALDGLSLWPIVTGAASQTDTPNRYCIITEIDFSRAALCGGVFKFVSNGDGEEATRIGYPASADAEQLYNLVSDSTEQTNLVGDHDLNSLVSALRDLIDCHDAHTAPGSGSAGCSMEAVDNAVAAAVAGATEAPTKTPTSAPTATPTGAPTKNPTRMPTDAPTANPTGAPTKIPTNAPTGAPTSPPSGSPTSNPTTTETPSTGSTTAPCVRRCGKGGREGRRKGAKRSGRTVSLRGVTVELP